MNAIRFLKMTSGQNLLNAELMQLSSRFQLLSDSLKTLAANPPKFQERLHFIRNEIEGISERLCRLQLEQASLNRPG